MNTNQKDKNILAISLPLAVLVSFVSIIGLYMPGFYALETQNWQAQTIGQDMIDLFLIVPLLLLTTVLAYNNNKTALILWGSVVFYLLYTFILYCFDIHFNRLFIIYCFTLGLSFYSVVYFLFSQTKAQFFSEFRNETAVKITGYYLLIIPLAFSFLWLSEIIPAFIDNSTPKSLQETGLPTNGVQALDLSILLPGIFITGILTLKRKKLGLLIAPVLLGFFVLMDISIATLIVVMHQRGIESNLMVTVVMSVLALFSLIMLIWYLYPSKKRSAPSSMEKYD